jgi:hypothetical protein
MLTLDPLPRNIGTFYRHGWSEWIPRIMVHLCVPIPYLVFVYYSYQVCLFLLYVRWYER